MSDEIIRKSIAHLQSLIEDSQRQLAQMELEGERLRERQWRTDERRHREYLTTLLVAAEIARGQTTLHEIADGEWVGADDPIVSSERLVRTISEQVRDDDSVDDGGVSPPPTP